MRHSSACSSARPASRASNANSLFYPVDPSLETALAALRQLRNDRQNGLITDRDYDRRIAALLQGQNAPALLAQLQAESGSAAPLAAPIPPDAPPVAAHAPAAPPAAVPVEAAPEPVAPAPAPEPSLAAAFGGLPVSPPAAPAPLAQEDEAAAELGAPPANSSTLNYVLMGSGLLLLALVVVYLLRGQGPSEHLTSASRTAADTTATAPEVGPQAPPLARPPVAAPETVRVFPKTMPGLAPAADSATGAPAAPAADSTAAGPAAPAETDAAAEQAVRGALASYYADLQAAPFDAGAHFAPTVERFLLLRGTTPAAIAGNLATSHFPEFQDYQAGIAPGSLRVSAPTADGSRLATYTEVARSFRPALQQHQQTRTQVRVRFTPDYKIDYLRQEKVLENTLTP